MKYLFITLLLVQFSIFKSLGQSKSHVRSLIKKSWAKSETSLDSAEVLIVKAIDIAKENGYRKELAEGKCYRGIYLDMKGHSDQALKLFLEAIKTQKKIVDNPGLSFTYTNISLLHYAQYDHDQAIKFMLRSLDIKKKLGDRNGMGGCYSNLAIFYTHKEETETALRYSKQAENIAIELLDTFGLISVYGTRSTILIKAKEYNEALPFIEKSRNILEKYPNRYYERVSNNIAFGTVYENTGQFEKAEKHHLEALRISKELGSKEREQFCYEALQRVTLKQKDYKRAHEYLLAFASLRDTLLNEERTSSINELQVKYNVAEKDSKLAIQQKKQTILIISSALLFVVIVFLAIVYFLKRKLADSLKVRNDVMKSSLEQKEVMMLEIHHRVKNNLQLVSSILSLKANSLSDPNSIKALQDSKEKIYSMSQLHRYLYKNEGLDSVNLKNYIEGLVEELTLSFKRDDQEFFYDLDLCNNTIVNVDTAVSVGLVVNELVNNVFKHSAEKTDDVEFNISLKNDGPKGLELHIEDKGRGCSDSKEMLIKRSFGLKMVDSLIKQLSGNWEIFNQNGMKHVINFQTTN